MSLFFYSLVPLHIVSSDPYLFNDFVLFTCRYSHIWCSAAGFLESVLRRANLFWWKGLWSSYRQCMTQYLNISISGERDGLQKWEWENGKGRKIGNEMKKWVNKIEESEWAWKRGSRVITPGCLPHLNPFKDSQSDIWLMIEGTRGRSNWRLNSCI